MKLIPWTFKKDTTEVVQPLRQRFEDIAAHAERKKAEIAAEKQEEEVISGVLSRVQSKVVKIQNSHQEVDTKEGVSETSGKITGDLLIEIPQNMFGDIRHRLATKPDIKIISDGNKNFLPLSELRDLQDIIENYILGGKFRLYHPETKEKIFEGDWTFPYFISPDGGHRTLNELLVFGFENPSLLHSIRKPQ